jgi:hypothetical protein
VTRARLLVMVLAAPAIWLAYFLAGYATVALWCARWAGPGGDLGAARAWLAAGTLAALLAIGVTAAWALRERRRPDAETGRFLAHLGLLLCALSAVATLYVGAAALVLESCR